MENEMIEEVVNNEDVINNVYENVTEEVVSTSNGSNVGAVVGVVLAIAAVVGGAIFYKKRKAKKENVVEYTVETVESIDETK